MTFIWPSLLFALLVLPLFLLLYLRMQRQRRELAARYGSLGLSQQADGHKLGKRRHIPPLLFLFSLAILTVALARPQAVVSLPRLEGNVILAFDVSGSMAADDFKPTRMDAAKAAARDFVQHQPPTVQIGIVAFSDSGVSVQTPTNDQEAILAAINRLTPQRGTSLANGIFVSLNAIDVATKGKDTHFYSNLTPVPTPTPTPVPQGTYTSSVIVLLTDGENNENPDPLGAAQTAADRGVRIYTVGIGSPQGTTIKINGFTIHTELNEPMLKQISQITNGEYYNAQNQADLKKVYDNLDAQLVIKPEKTEVTSIFAGVSILLLLIGGVFSLLWFSRLP